MNIKVNLSNAYQGLVSNKLRAALSSLWIIIWVFSVVLLLAIGDGVQKSVLKTIESLGSNLLFIAPGWGQTDILWNKGGKSQQDVLTRELAEAIERNVANVSGVSAEITAQKVLIHGQNTTKATVNGVLPVYQTVRNVRVQYGEFVSEKQESELQKVAVIGTKVAGELFPGENPIGQTIRIDGLLFTVIGVMENKDQQWGFTDPNKTIYIPLSTALTRLLWTKYLSAIAVSVSTKDAIPTTQQQLTEFLLRYFHILDELDANFTIISQEEILKTVSQITDILKTFLAAIAVISLIVGGIGIMNIMLVSVTERTREIGIRKCIGAQRSDILLQFLAESVYLTVFGGLVGLLLSYLIVLLIGRFGVEASVSSGAVILAISFSVSVGVIFGLLPAYRASKLKPIEALRYE